ncbi:hypothetical protein L7G72_20845 [Xenorhabdus bovienii]|uniref:hypothetical protein n=1 Tax=Xenorhabdus bovienii TaxID=40576 RepID=UPI001EE13D41|nr:hypothetical protein [Xenorhabdus bovienii]MCG3464199.1 hypothetical protein [Xenorhabdus bovienii]
MRDEFFECFIDDLGETTQHRPVPFESTDTYHAIARSGFGKLYLCGEQTEINLTLDCVFNTFFILQKELIKKRKKN